MERRERQLQRAYRRLWEAITLGKKRQRQSHTHHCQQFTRAEFPAGQLPAKFGWRPIKLELYPLVHTYVSRELRARARARALQDLRVYKESGVAYRAIRVRVS